jgi:SAM-dependent methyltransferase
VFKDHFSAQAADYGRYRPGYPEALIAFVAAVAPGQALALDVATGNGQAAQLLAGHFDRVLASDASAAQLRQAQPHPRVHYLRHRAEQLPLRAGVADAIAVAQAAHWFDLDSFYQEARRVLRPGGVVALWTYSGVQVEAPVDVVLQRFYHEVVGPFWPPERHHVEQEYRSLRFPLTELPAPAFAYSAQWSLPELLGYVGTWSAVAGYRRARGVDPLPALAAELAGCWPADQSRAVRFPLHLRIGRI